MQLRIPKPVRYFGVFLGVLLLLGLPLIVKSPYVLFIVELILTYIILTAGLNLPVGLTGQFPCARPRFGAWGLIFRRSSPNGWGFPSGLLCPWPACLPAFLAS